MKYVDTKVWLRVPGGVCGWDPDDLNHYIDEWNRSYSLHAFGTFWDWLSFKTGDRYYGYSSLWYSKQLSKMHTIKGGDSNAWSD